MFRLISIVVLDETTKTPKCTKTWKRVCHALKNSMPEGCVRSIRYTATNLSSVCYRWTSHLTPLSDGETQALRAEDAFARGASSVGSGRSHARQQDVQSRTSPAFSLSSSAPFRGHFSVRNSPKSHLLPHLPVFCLTVSLGAWMLFAPRLPWRRAVARFCTFDVYVRVGPISYHKYLHCHSVLSVLHSIRAAPNPGNIIAQTSSCSAVQLLPKGRCLWLNQDQTNPPRHKVVMRASNPWKPHFPVKPLAFLPNIRLWWEHLRCIFGKSSCGRFQFGVMGQLKDSLKPTSF